MGKIEERARKLRAQIENLSDHMTDGEALENAELLPKWETDKQYMTGQRVTHNGVVYKILTDHISQSTWNPADAPSLFAKVLIPDENIIPEWEQPDSTNPYMMGDKVTHNGKTWESEIDNNVWEPGVYGWKEVGVVL